MSNLKVVLQKEIEKAFTQQGPSGIVVWYDPGGTLESLIESDFPGEIQVLRYKGSYLALRFELESADPSFEKRWLIYVPEKAPDPSWLRDYELLGEKLDLDLLELLARGFKLPISQRLKKLLRKHIENAKELALNWDFLIGGQKVTEDVIVNALLSIAFGLPQWNPNEAILTFVTSKDWKPKLEKRGLWEEWRGKLAEWTDLSKTPDDENKLRETLQNVIILSELVEYIPEIAGQFAILPSQNTKRKTFSIIARAWREKDTLQSSYYNTALRIERDYRLEKLLGAIESILTVETLPVIDKILQEEIRHIIASVKNDFKDRFFQAINQAINIADKRRQLFWAKQDQEIKKFWETVWLSGKLISECNKAISEIPRIRKRDELVNRYTQDNGWWKFDLWALSLADYAQNIPETDKKLFVQPAFNVYTKYLDEVNRAFAEAVEREGWIPSQITFWNKYVPKREQTAVFFVDALRFDLAKYLFDEIKHLGDFKVYPLLTVLPSITELGMTAVLPRADEHLKVVYSKGRLKTHLQDFEISRLSDRKKWLQQHLGEKGKITHLDEIYKTDLKETEILVVLSQEIDEFGTFVIDLYPRGLFDMVQKIVRAVDYLAKNDIKRIVIVADHGFLFVPQQLHLPTLKAPPAKIVKRRFAIGSNVEGCFNCGTDKLGFSGDLLFSFPHGLALFALTGERGAFLHGGLSLQECVVGVIVGKLAAPSRKVAATMKLKEPITSRVVAIQIIPSSSSLLDLPRKVQVRIGEKMSEIIKITPGSRSIPLTLNWLDFGEAPPEAIKFELIDVDTGEILDEKVVAVSLRF